MTGDPTSGGGVRAGGDGESAAARVGWRTLLAVAARPSLWWTALVQVARLAPRRWWRRPPHLPVPDRAYLRFRAQTFAGDPDAPLRPADVVSYLKWCSRMRRLAR